MPFADEQFDVVWTQFASMNIPGARVDRGRQGDKATRRGSWPEQRRVVRPSGRLVLQEVFARPGGDLVCRLFWARDPATSFLVPPEQVRTLLREAGIEERVWLPRPPRPQLSAQTGCRQWTRRGGMEANARRNHAEQRTTNLPAVCVRH